MKKIIRIILLGVFTIGIAKANTPEKRIIKGSVVDAQHEPLAGANVFWDETQLGVVSNIDGFFELATTDESNVLVISFVGYLTQKVNVAPTDSVFQVVMSDNIVLSEVVVSQRRMGTITSRTSLLQTQRITYDEICRAACCNLGESFETNPSVDVSYSDAATGARQIKLLGLAGTYVQMLTENFPNFRGAASLYGLDYVPGAWLDGIQISKGTSSVKNGYEALAGQIDVEFRKPQTADPLSVNLFVADNGRVEANVDVAQFLSPKVSTGFLLHYSNDEHSVDHDKDGFLDRPLREQVNLFNRWNVKSGAYAAQYGIRYVYEDRVGGQDIKHNKFSNPYRIGIRTNRVEGFTKQAYMMNEEKLQSLALIVSGSYHNQKSHFDTRLYKIKQNNFYVHLMYENQLTEQHHISIGLNMNYDDFEEELTVKKPEHFPFDEWVTGAYAQYTFNWKDRLIFMSGLRCDYSSKYGFFVTPRAHLKYNPFKWVNLRASLGKGYRTPHVLAENSNLFGSSRKVLIETPFDLEEAWNYGGNSSFYIPLFGKDITLNAEWYRTEFKHQVVVDRDSDPHEIGFYNLKSGDRSHSDSYQVEVSYPVFTGFTLTGAWRRAIAKTDFTNRKTGVKRFLKHPLATNYKALLTISYQTPLKKWQFDWTTQFNGGGRMPIPDKAHPLWNTDFGSYSISNAQITKYFRHWSIYMGGENIFNFTQKNPIVDAKNPRSENFDATMIWGPLHGATYYIGLRFAIDKD